MIELDPVQDAPRGESVKGHVVSTSPSDAPELPQRRDLVHRKIKKKPTEVPHHKQNECVANRQQPPRGGQGFRRADGSVQRDRQAGGDPPCSAHHRQQSRHRQEAAGQKQLKVEDRGPVTPQMEPQGGFPSALGPLKAVVQNGNDGCEREERQRCGLPGRQTPHQLSQSIAASVIVSRRLGWDPATVAMSTRSASVNTLTASEAVTASGSVERASLTGPVRFPTAASAASSLTRTSSAKASSAQTPTGRTCRFLVRRPPPPSTGS